LGRYCTVGRNRPVAVRNSGGGFRPRTGLAGLQGLLGGLRHRLLIRGGLQLLAVLVRVRLEDHLHLRTRPGLADRLLVGGGHLVVGVLVQVRLVVVERVRGDRLAAQQAPLLLRAETLDAADGGEEGVDAADGTWPFWISRFSMSRITVCCIAVEFAMVEPTSTSSASASPSCSPRNV
jgi:hypothetical protein